MSPRDLTPPPKRTPEELDRVSEITEADLTLAEDRANRQATPELKRFLDATAEEATDE